MSSITLTIEAGRLSKQQLAVAASNFGRMLKAHDDSAVLTVHEPRAGRPVMIDVEAESVYTEAGLVPISTSSHRIIVLLHTSGGVVSIQQIADHLGVTPSADAAYPGGNIRSLIRRTRDSLGKLDLIETIRGKGYRLNPAYTYIETGGRR